MQTLKTPPTRPQTEVSPELAHWALDDLTKDHRLLESELNSLDIWQSNALVRLLISQSVAIRNQIEIEGRGRGEVWTGRARLARSCKEANIAAVNAHIFDLDMLAKVAKQNREQEVIEYPNGIIPYDQLLAKCDRLQAELETLHSSEAHCQKYKRTLYQVLMDTLGGTATANIREDVHRRLNDA